MKLGPWKPPEIANVIVMQMRQHHRFHRGRIHANQPECIDGATQELALAFARHRFGEPDINDHARPSPIATQTK